MDKVMLDFGGDFAAKKQERFIERMLLLMFAAVGVDKRFVYKACKQQHTRLTVEWFNENSGFRGIVNVMLPPGVETLHGDIHSLFMGRAKKSWAGALFSDTLCMGDRRPAVAFTTYRDTPSPVGITTEAFDLPHVYAQCFDGLYIYSARQLTVALSKLWDYIGVEALSNESQVLS